MRIGEIATLVGLTTRAIRHYHPVGLLPEPERRPDGYRAYSVRDAVLLARAGAARLESAARRTS